MIDKETKDGSLRLMTPGEVKMAKDIFRETINDSKVWIHKGSYFFPVLLTSLLTGCGLLGDYTPLPEIGQVLRSKAGFCFQIRKPGDYYVHYLSIRERSAPERSGFNREFPALPIADNQLCIPPSYYHFPDDGEINVDIALRSPTKKREYRRDIISEFRMINGVPMPFAPKEYSVRTDDYMREIE